MTDYKKEVEEAADRWYEPKHGRWVHKYGDGHTEPAITGGECSLCGFVNTTTNYCPNCGARMDEVKTCRDCAHMRMCIMSAPDGRWMACEDFVPKKMDEVKNE